MTNLEQRPVERVGYPSLLSDQILDMIRRHDEP